MEKSTNKSTNRSKAPDAPEDRFRGDNFDLEWQQLIKGGSGGNII
jgi:hypothetical protein